jgi:hypothetical protein
MMRRRNLAPQDYHEMGRQAPNPSHMPSTMHERVEKEKRSFTATRLSVNW